MHTFNHLIIIMRSSIHRYWSGQQILTNTVANVFDKHVKFGFIFLYYASINFHQITESYQLNTARVASSYRFILLTKTWVIKKMCTEIDWLGTKLDLYCGQANIN